MNASVFLTSFWLAALIGLGWLWTWSLPGPGAGNESRVRAWWWTAAVSVLAGWLGVLAVGYGLGWVGGWTPVYLGGCLGALALAGYGLGPRPRAWPCGGLLLGLLAIGLLLLWPGRGAWLVGGWDPGLYVNEGAAAARLGSFADQPVPFYQRLGPGAMFTLTAAARGYRELFPGLPIDLEAGAWSLQFPRLTSVAFAVPGLLGGLDALWRTPLLLAATAWLIWVAGLGTTLRSRPAWVGAAVVLGGQPIFLYHTHTPASELLELVLVGALFLVRGSGATPRARAGWSALVLLAAAANRTSFVLFGAGWLVLVALADLRRADRRTVAREHLLLIAALAVGAYAHHVVTPVAVLKLVHILPRIEGTAAALAGLVGLIDLAAARPGLRARGAACVGPGLRLFLVLGLLALGALVWRSGSEAARNLQAMGPYLGWPLLGLAGLGLLAYAWRGRAVEVLLLLAWCLAVTLVVLQHKHVADLYPWATKRYLPFTVPLLAWGVGLLLELVPMRPRMLVACAVGLALMLHLPFSVAAWRATSYDTLPPVLTDVAGQLREADGVVADHFQWATPLALAWGCPVVNGEALWRAPESEATRAVWHKLNELVAAGQRILILTSVGEGSALWGPGAPTMELLWSSGPVTYRETVHHRSERGFHTREKEREFRVYQLVRHDG